MKHILILGGSYAGVSTAHRLLKSAPKSSIKITLVSPNTHFYWSMASCRAVIPGGFTDEQVFQPVAPGFEQYPAGQFKFIAGSAESLDVEGKEVAVSGATGNQVVGYDFLVLATGSKAKGDLPFKGLGSTKTTKNALHEFQERVKKAGTIVVAGGGVTGCEVAGELAYEYGRSKEIILIASGPSILPVAPSSVFNLATKYLHDLHVDLKLQTKVLSTLPLPNNQVELALSTGSTIKADMYIPTFGLVPNSSYIPSTYLNSDGHVLVDDYLRVQGLKDVWAIGDVSCLERPQFLTCDRQSAHVAKNLVLILKNQAPVEYKIATRPIGIQIGRKTATGFFGTWRMPSWLMVWARKNLFTEKLKPTVDGTLF
ncbi:FAD/NAD(P)-binding domain-containing protein [Acephala macrosclerotiorum]|nr:FAD/NAD(P)-binding domain-containing protein [Acephala macrosclerotiorum]